jgi:hypothetical protein
MAKRQLTATEAFDLRQAPRDGDCGGGNSDKYDGSHRADWRIGDRAEFSVTSQPLPQSIQEQTLPTIRAKLCGQVLDK